MEHEVAGIAERLVEEFDTLPWTVVMETVCECADACTDCDSFFVEQAARAALGRASQFSRPAARRPARTLAALPSLDGPPARLRSGALPSHAPDDARNGRN
jgi:hypothetical protein